ncbi:MAG TPA: hypothetical protein P5305_01235 [Rubrivivax sp.]|nr:hypothetical protein [Rubrivivax sp.]HRY86475.1 hypothetical protein [Rubrivivax sp.]
MAKIVDPDGLVVGTNLALDTSAKTFTLTAAGSLVAKDGVSLQALYSKFVELWTTSTYNKYPFPMYAIDVRSGQFQLGTDGQTYNGWKPANDATRQMIRDAGWSEYSAAGALLRQYVGLVALASGFPAGAQFYYQRASGGSAIDATFTDAPNEALQVYGDAANGNFDNRTYFKLFCRPAGYTFDDAVLADVGETGTGAFKLQLPISVATDLKITVADGSIGSAPYSGIAVEFFGTNQNKTIGGGSYPFRKIVQGNGATLEQIYTKAQYLLRQSGDIDSGAGTVTGKTADQLMYFVGDTLYTTQGVFIENFDANDTNRVVFLDQNNVQRSFPYVSAGTMTFNSVLQGAGSYYRMYYATGPGAGDDYGEASAITVLDNADAAIAGSISSGSVSFTFDYDNDAAGGTAGTDKPVVIVAGRPGYAKPVVATGTITRSKGLVFALVAEADRGYSNP